MAVTAFTGEIYFLKGTPFTPDYKHSIYFSSLSAQQTYMQSKVDRTLTEQNYVKTESGKIRVQSQEEHIRDCNYMMWKTPVIGDSSPDPAYTWMYAFILGIDYVSNNVSEITYAIDVLQTYALFNVTFHQCMIERMHVNDDSIGKHIEPEPVSFSDYKVDLLGNVYEDSSRYKWLVYAPFKFPVDTAQILEDGINHRLKYVDSMGVRCGLPQGLICTVFKNLYSLESFVNNLPDDIASQIVAIVGVPYGFVMGADDLDPAELSETGSMYQQTSDVVPRFDLGIDGYTQVKNNKLYTYPYYSLLVSDGEGNQNTYRWEYFKRREPSGSCRFELTLAIQPEPELMMVPVGYGTHAGAVGNEHIPNYDEKIVLKNFPHAAWVGNSFSAWMANQGLNMGVNALMTVLGGASMFNMNASPDYSGIIQYATGGGMSVPGQQALPGGGMPNVGTKFNVTGHPGMAAAGAVGMGLKLGSSIAQAVRKPNNAHGYGAAGAMLAKGAKHPRYYTQHINNLDAKRIDDFFTCFGYAVNILGTPSMTNSLRNQHFIKTANCLVTGRCASEYCRQIEMIFNSGVTWWKSPSVVGDYN